MTNKLITKKDAILILTIIIIGFALMGVWHFINAPDSESAIYAEIRSDFGVYSADLENNRTFYIDELPNVVFEVRDERIAFVQSDCPDGVCIMAGFLGRAGQTAACLPNNIVVFLSSRGDMGTDDLDIFVQ